MPDRFLRGLALPDWDAPQAPPAPAEPDLPTLLEEARREGHAAGLREGETRGRAAEAASREAMAEESVRMALLTLDEGREITRKAAEENARALARLVMGAVDAALPGAAARFAPDLLEPLVAALGPLVDAPLGATLQVPPALLDHARARFGAALPVEADPALPEGDARIAWRRGGLDLDLGARRAAIRDVLVSLNLLDEESSA
ncbi:hypothetical protein [Muricoccus radiodurans]|uniref:FliH/SctL family protein n=1 Tax=Muricoccus radiodurans TaxID=2231721 RepID=UPI003CF4894E